MVRRKCKHCPIPGCGSKFLIRLADHLTRVHDLLLGPSRRLTPVIKCSPFLTFFQRYIVRDISLTLDIAGSLLLGVLAGSLKFYPLF